MPGVFPKEATGGVPGLPSCAAVPLSTQAHDVFRGFIKAREYVKQQGYNADNIIVIGSSAGDIWAACLFTTKELQAQYAVKTGMVSGACLLGRNNGFFFEYPDATEKAV